MQSHPNQEYRNLPVVQLQESPTNPRRRFNEDTLKELAASFHSQGVLQPLVVRALPEEKYEVVAGARRFRAAQIAGLETVPVRVVELSDAAAIEAQVVENLQREDIHPLEEALGFRALLDLHDPQYTVASIAAKAGKSEAYVLGRIKLTELIPPIAEAFLADRITIGHALLIAKLPAGQQQEACNAAFRQMWTSGGNTQVLIPVRELAAWIESNILLELAAAPFSKSDEALVPEAGSCAACPKRTGFNALLFSDVRKDSCTDPQCFRAKVDAHIAKSIERKPELVQISSAWSSREGAPLGRNRYVELEVTKSKNWKGSAPAAKVSAHQKPCEKMSEAVVMDGGKRGQIVKVCADPNCKVHHGDRPSPQQLAKERAEERKRIAREKLAITIRHHILAKVLERVSAPLKKADLAMVAEHAVTALSHYQLPQLAKRHKIANGKQDVSVDVVLKAVGGFDENALAKLLLEVSLLDAAYQRGARRADDPLLAAAKRYRVDCEKVEKMVTAEFATKAQKSARKNSSGKAEGAA
jgi:ParB family chromosome partitioning protein